MRGNRALLNNVHGQKCERTQSTPGNFSLTHHPIRIITMATSAGGQQLRAACEGNRRNSAIMRDRSERVAFKVCHVNNKLYLTCRTTICETYVTRELDIDLRHLVIELWSYYRIIFCQRQKSCIFFIFYFIILFYYFIYLSINIYLNLFI